MLTPAQDECFANVNQEFLICTTVHKARHLAIFNSETFVRLILEKANKHTKPFANSENPHFNEYFVFELKCTLSELLRLTILYEVKKRVACKKAITVGELLVDLHSVWNQPNRCFFKKWGRLETPIGNNSSSVAEQGKGFLQIDLAIVTQATNTNVLLHPYEGDIMGMNKWQINQDYDDIEKNLLQNLEKGVQCNIRYLVTFYRGYFTKKTEYIIQFRFHPFKGKTNASKASTQPEWNQEVSFAWTFPSVAQTFLIQLLSHDHLQWKCIAEYELHFDEIAFKDKPCLGPTFLHLYDSFNPSHYVGRILIELQSECLNAGITRELTTRSVAAIDEKRWWQDETFIIEFLPLQGDFIHCSYSNSKIHLSLSEHTSAPVECFLRTYPGKTRVAKSSLKFFRQELPYKAIYLNVTLPDNRHKFNSDFFMQDLLDLMKTEVEAFKLFQLKYTNQFQLHTKCFKAIIMSIVLKIKQGIDNKQLAYNGFKDPTVWDANRFIHLQEFFNKLPDELQSMRKKLKVAESQYIEHAIEEVVLGLVSCSNELANLLAMTRVQDDWPNLMIVLTTSGKDVAVCRLNAKYFLNPPKEKYKEKDTANALCWRVKNFVFKDIHCHHSCIHCGCNVGIIQGCLGIVVESERNDHMAAIANDWKQAEPFYWSPKIPKTTFKCRLFIHQAKVRPGNDHSGLCDAHVRVIFGTQSAETPTEHATLAPIWNVVISMEGITMPGPLHWYVQNPPLVAIELYDTDRHTKDDYLGCGMLAVAVISSDKADANARDDAPESSRKGNVLSDMGKIVKTRNALQKFQQLKTLSPPPLKWVSIAQNGGVRAEVLMSAEMVETQLDGSKSAIAEATTTNGIPNSIRPNMRNFVLEVVFAGFRNYTKGFSGRHRIKIMMGELMLMSGLSSTRIRNSINFLVLYASGVVSLPEQLEYWPAIIATDMAVSARGSETTIGAVLISNSKRFLHRQPVVMCTTVGGGAQIENAVSIGSTTIHMGDAHNDTEKRPLLSNNQRKGTFSRLFTLKKAKDDNRLQPPSLSKGKKIEKNPSGKNFVDAANITENDYTWWTKFYNSLYLESIDSARSAKHMLKIYHSELEKQGDLSYLRDWAEPVKLVHGVKYKKNAMPKEEVYATLKLHIKLMPCQCGTGNDGGDGAMLRPLAAALNPRYQAQLQSLAELCKIVARVYVVQGIQFRPHDNHTQSDAYVKLSLGSVTSYNRAHYVPNQSNPIFGKCFQLEGVLPRDHLLEVSIFDRNTLRDEVIGSTFIDLEDRWRTKHRATVGIANEYSKNGYNKWRDIATPLETLTYLCMKREIMPPKFVGNTVEVDGKVFADETRIATDEDRHERLSLTALRHFETLPSFGYKLVPEHVETRSLYHKDCPGIEQGKIQLWVELYEGNLNIPPAIDITPQPPQIYELRVTILNCSDVVLDEKNIFGKRMSDLFVRGWCHDPAKTQTTDIHYRSLNGEGNFNWRMIFPLKYSAIEDMMVTKRKSGLLDEYETKQPAILYLQIWDNDVISRDDFLGMIELNLSNLVQPSSTKKGCTLPYDDGYFNSSKYRLPFASLGKRFAAKGNLFRDKKVKGWFPLHGGPNKGASSSRNKLKGFDFVPLTGKLEMELEILTDAEAASSPAGLGRNPPNALLAPVRPDTSFNPLTSPAKAFTHILLPFIKKFLIVVTVVILFLIFVITAFTDLPKTLFGLG